MPSSTGANNVQLSDFQALSFDCYGALVDWEAGLAAVLAPWSAGRGLTMDTEELLARYADQKSRAEADHPSDLYPRILARSFRGLGADVGASALRPDRKHHGTGDHRPYAAALGFGGVVTMKTAVLVVGVAVVLVFGLHTPGRGLEKLTETERLRALADEVTHHRGGG